MAGNFLGTLNFVIFMVDLAVIKFPPTKFNAYISVERCGQNVEAQPATIATIIQLIACSSR
jgi:hypothetical protein